MWVNNAHMEENIDYVHFIFISFSSGSLVPRWLNNVSNTCSTGKVGYKAAQLTWSPWTLHNIFQIQIVSKSTQTVFEIPDVLYPSSSPTPFLFQVSDMRSLCSGSRGSLEMLPTYLVSWHYNYGEIDAISSSNSKINRGKQGLGDSGHGNVSCVSGAYSDGYLKSLTCD